MITILIFVHELGHFLFARWFGVFVEDFSIGFGKRLFSFFDKHKTRWNIRALPLGGFIKMKGEMLPLSKTTPDADTSTVSFHNKRLWQKMLIVAGGPLF